MGCIALQCRMIDRRDKKQMTVMMPAELGKNVENVVGEHEEMSESSFVREALRHELQRYEIEGYSDE